MTRSKEQRRIDNGIQYGDVVDLKWALKYCQLRINTAKLKQHEKTWKNQLNDVQKALEEAEKKWTKSGLRRKCLRTCAYTIQALNC